MNFAKTDLSYDLAYRAHYCTSFSPDKRAEQEQANYFEHMQNLVNELTPLATTDEQKAILKADLLRYQAKYIQMYSACLSAQSRTMSSMITGPANFPVRRNQKALNIEHSRRTEFAEWQTKARKAIKNKFVDTGIISSDDPRAIEKLEAKVASLTKLQATMKAANAIMRKKKLTDEQRTAALLEIGLSAETVAKITSPNFLGGLGFPGYSLTNNNATIKTAQARLDKLKAEANATTAEIEVNGITILDNVEANRVQILFPGKPSDEVRSQLKARGFKWAPSQSAWQRMRSNDAMRYAQQIVSAM